MGDPCLTPVLMGDPFLARTARIPARVRLEDLRVLLERTPPGATLADFRRVILDENLLNKKAGCTRRDGRLIALEEVPRATELICQLHHPKSQWLIPMYAHGPFLNPPRRSLIS